MFKKNQTLVSADVILDAVLPEQHLAVPLTVLVIPTPEKRTPLSREQKLVRWIIAIAIAFGISLCAAAVFVTWFLVTYQIQI